jgi:hypothetical protein
MRNRLCLIVGSWRLLPWSPRMVSSCTVYFTLVQGATDIWAVTQASDALPGKIRAA